MRSGGKFIAGVLIALSAALPLLCLPLSVEAATTLVKSNVTPGWGSNSQRVPFYSGLYFFEIYSDNSSNLLFKASPDNATWSTEQALVTDNLAAFNTFNIYMVDDSKFDLIYVRNTDNFPRVKTCIISGQTITCDSGSTPVAESWFGVSVARTPGSNRIYAAGRIGGGELRVYSADQTGDAAGISSWTGELVFIESTVVGGTAMAPYSGSDKVLVILQRDPGGTNADGIYSRVITRGGGAGARFEIGNLDSTGVLSNAVRVSDTAFHYILDNTGVAPAEYVWNDTSWTGPTALANTNTTSPALKYDRTNDDLYMFAIDTGTDDVMRYRKPSGGSWDTGTIADGGEVALHTLPVTHMVEPPAGSGRSACEVVWGYRVANGGNFDLYFGNLNVGFCPKVSCPTVTSTEDSGPGTLRQCITYANSNPGTTIDFDIPDNAPGYTTSGGKSWWRISPASALPAITASGSVIDGTTQAANYGSETNGTGPEIEVNGLSAGAGINGLTFSATADSSEVHGLMITRFTADGVRIQNGSDGITVADNWIGTDGTGLTNRGNVNGIYIQGADNIIDGNVVVNNTNEGINLTGGGATGNVITGNIIGLEPDGVSGSGNGDVGIALLTGAANTTIGGTTAAERNIISLNFEGIEVNTAGNIIQGNYIGTDITGTQPRGNDSDDGVEINNSAANNNAIGGTAAGAGNLIAFNQLRGVTVKAGTGNKILGNDIHSNNSMGIDLSNNGVTPNDGTTGALPNIGMDYPVLTAAAVAGTVLHVEGYVGTAALKIAGTHIIELFKADDDGGSNGEIEAGDALSVGHGEGRWYIDRCLSAADGTFDCYLTVPGTVTLAVADSVTATATDPAGNTSEFGANYTVAPSSCPTVTTTSDTGSGSLRDCIGYANVNPGTTIIFDIPDTAPGYTTSGGNSWWRIAPASALPAITANGTVIDGTTQAVSYGSDTNSQGPEIEIDGTGAGAGVNGLTVNVPGGSAAIRHLVVDNFNLSGILLQGGSTTVTGSYLGLEPDGDTLAGNNTSTTSYHGGIRIVSANNTIGGTDAADRNVISGNTLAGIVLNGAGATGNQVLGNYIGLDATGTLDRGNISDGEGIEFQLADGNTIGGTAPGAGNVISGNASDGMEIDGSSNNIVQGNYIGTDYTGTVVIPNDRDGIDINSDLATGSTGNLIGGTVPGAGNLIRGNGIAGVELRDDTVVGATTGNSILGNIIYGNGGLGIDLAPGGVTLNDAGDSDNGVNGLQNFPVITAATSAGTSTTVTGTLSSQPTSTYQLEFYYNAAPDPLGYGEGESFLGTTSVTTDGTGNAAFTVNFPVDLTPGMEVTATATNPTGSTSEFAANSTVFGICVSPGPDVIYYACFDDTAVSTLPAGWTVSAGAGGVVVKVDGATQVLSDGLVGGAPVTSGNPAWTDVSVSQRFRSLTGVVDHAGVIARYVDDSNMVYGGIVTATEAEVWNRIGGTWNQLGPTWTIPDVGTSWHTQEMRVAGDRVDLYIDGSLVGSATLMAGAPAAGRTGFWSQYGALEGYRDDHTVRDGFYLLEGTVFEDADFDGTPAAYDGGVSDQPLEAVDVELYSGTDVYIGSAVAGSDGSYGFVVQDGSYKVRARSATIGDADTPPAGGLNPTVPGTWPYPLPDMTWGDGSAMPGGQSGAADDADTGDNAGPGDTWVPVTVSGADVTGVDLGFAYNLIVSSVDDALADSTRSHQGSLRQFLKNANAIGTAAPTTAGSSEFSLPNTDAGYTTSGGDAWWRIAPTSALPSITDTGTVIDGATQAANYGSDTNSQGPEIEIDGTGAGAGVAGFTITGGNSSIEGLVINRFGGDGVLITTNGGNTLLGNYIGTDPSGTVDLGNGDEGVDIRTADNRVGGIDVSDRNIISGNADDGLAMESTSATSNSILGNYIGVDATGNVAIANSANGVSIANGASDNAVGGSAGGAGNIISGNVTSGIFLRVSSSTGNMIRGNLIGTDSTGTVNVGNGADGIQLTNGTGDNVIGGTGSGEGNTIAFNGQRGVWLDGPSTDQNSVQGNSIYNNGGMGIDLSPSGVTPNDGTTGMEPNDGMDYPVITAAAVAGTVLHVEGYVGTSAVKIAGTHIIELFKAVDDGGSNGEIESGDGLSVGHGEGRWYIDRCLSAADGTFNCDLTVPGTVPLAVADSITATATDTAGNTSEFGANTVLALDLVKQASLASDGSLIANASTLPRGTVFKFLIYTDNFGPARSDVSIRDVLDSAFAYSTGSLKVDNSASVGASVQAIYTAVNGTSPLTDVIDADVASITGSTIDVGNRYVANGQLNIAANRIWALLFTVRMQ